MLKVLADDGYTTTTCNKDVEHHRDRARAWTTKYNVDVSKYIKDNFIRYQNDVFLWKHAYTKGRLSYHLCVECFSQLSFVSEVYTKSAVVADFVYTSESNESCEKHSTKR